MQFGAREPDVAAGALIRCGTLCGLDEVPEDRGTNAAGPVRECATVDVYLGSQGFNCSAGAASDFFF